RKSPEAQPRPRLLREKLASVVSRPSNMGRRFGRLCHRPAIVGVCGERCYAPLVNGLLLTTINNCIDTKSASRHHQARIGLTNKKYERGGRYDKTYRLQVGWSMGRHLARRSVRS